MRVLFCTIVLEAVSCREYTVGTVFCMGQHCAEWNHCSAGLARAGTNDEPPGAVLLVLLDLVKGERHSASLKLALMQSILDHGESEQALALAHGHPARGTLQLPLPVRDLI